MNWNYIDGLVFGIVWQMQKMSPWCDIQKCDKVQAWIKFKQKFTSAKIKCGLEFETMSSKFTPRAKHIDVNNINNLKELSVKC